MRDVSHNVRATIAFNYARVWFLRPLTQNCNTRMPHAQHIIISSEGCMFAFRHVPFTFSSRSACLKIRTHTFMLQQTAHFVIRSTTSLPMYEFHYTCSTRCIPVHALHCASSTDRIPTCGLHYQRITTLSQFNYDRSLCKSILCSQSCILTFLLRSSYIPLTFRQTYELTIT